MNTLRKLREREYAATRSNLGHAEAQYSGVSRRSPTLQLSGLSAACLTCHGRIVPVGLHPNSLALTRAPAAWTITAAKRSRAAVCWHANRSGQMAVHEQRWTFEVFITDPECLLTLRTLWS